jgi:hypothetical protein
VVRVEVDFADYRGLVAQREQALEEGVILVSSADFVPAVVRAGDEVVAARARLAEGPAVDLQADGTWPLEVRVEDDGRLLGARRFYLQDPALGLRWWAFTRSLEREGVRAADYRFVRLVFNGDDRGLYAFQEGPEGSGGVVAEFDADRLWEAVAHFDGDVEAAFSDPLANLSPFGYPYLEVDTARDADLDRVPSLVAQREEATALLHALQTGSRTPSGLLDVEGYARLLALAELWGVPEAVFPVNLKFRLDPATGRLEPVAFRGGALGEGGRLPLAATHGDPQVQEAYVREATRVSHPDYLVGLEDDLGAGWAELRAELGKDAGEAPWEDLAHRAALVRRSLRPVRPVFAYVAQPGGGTTGVLRVGVANALNLPVEVLGFDVGGATFIEVEDAPLVGGATALLGEGGAVLRAFDDGVLDYAYFDVPLSLVHRRDAELDFEGAVEVLVATRLLGGEVRQLTSAQQGLPALGLEGGE